MRKFKVLAYHIGDKEYEVGSARYADENEVKHLVDAGMLAPDGGEDGTPKPEAADNHDVAALRAEVETLTKERDDARASVETLTKERDEARAEVETLTKDADGKHADTATKKPAPAKKA